MNLTDTDVESVKLLLKMIQLEDCASCPLRIAIEEWAVQFLRRTTCEVHHIPFGEEYCSKCGLRWDQ